MRNVLFVRKSVVQVALIILLLVVVAVVFTRAQDRAWATSDTVAYNTLRASGAVAETRSTLRASAAVSETYNTLRVYGVSGWPRQPGEPPGNMGAGSGVVTDENTGLLAEDQPYTDTIAIFNPQMPQAPRGDSITWNPIFMSESETSDENQAKGLYHGLIASGNNASEKVWFRMWYEPEHWDKDLNANGMFDRDPITGEPTGDDEWYPAIMQEFTYLLMDLEYVANKPEPTYGAVGSTSLVFPVGMREGDIDDPYGYGLTSLDGNFDGAPEIVYVESEQTLQTRTSIAADFDGDGVMDPLDPDGVPLNGDELAVFRLNSFSNVPVGGKVQFLDHLVELMSVFDTGASLKVYYTGSCTPPFIATRSVDVGGMLLAGTGGGAVEVISPGGGNTGVPPGPFFVYVENVDPQEATARLMVGRALGATHSAMEKPPDDPDEEPGDPWFLKRFYVDGHEYNVVAIKTRGNTEFQFITIRTPIPKVPVTIQQHSVVLQDYPIVIEESLSVMPPYNYEHYILTDVQAITAFDNYEYQVDYLGDLVGPVPPILQSNGPFPYEGAYPDYPVGPYDNPRELYLRYVQEDTNPQLQGELKEKYGERLEVGMEEEFWYVEQWWTQPWAFTEFVLPDIGEAITGPDNPDLYLLTSSFTAPQSEYLYWIQDDSTPLRYNLSLGLEHAEGEDTITPELPGWKPRVKFWFDPAVGGRKYKGPSSLRLYGWENAGAGDTTVVTDTVVIVGPPTDENTAPVEVMPYTDPWAPFNPQLPQAPDKDSMTFNPAYMDESLHGGELPLRNLYSQISTDGGNAREKVFFRMWYEPEYVDKIRDTQTIYTFPALMQEFTYMYLDMSDRPSHGQPGSSQLAFPIGTASDELPAPDTVSGTLDSLVPPVGPPSFGYGLTTFDADFDGAPEAVTIHSERTLSETTGIQADFDGNGTLDQLDTDGVELSGDELVIFAIQDIELGRYESAMFLDYMVTVENVSWAPGPPSTADLKFWFTGGGIYGVGGDFSIHPPKYPIETRTLLEGEMAVVYRIPPVHVIPAGGNNLGSTDGAWFVYLRGVNTWTETATLTIGRALGATHSAIDDGAGKHDMTPGDPWYLKRFFVDGHEYNVVAIKTVPADSSGENFEFKYITIRTPVPKADFTNSEDSIVLQGYNQGSVFGVDTSIISVMPPFNSAHTRMVDIQRLEEGEFAHPDSYVTGCIGDWEGNVDPLQVQIVDETNETQFFGELKEKLWPGLAPDPDIWSTEQFHTLPDQYTDLKLPAGQLYLLTSDWESERSWVHYYGCDPTNGYFTQDELHDMHDSIPEPNAVITFTGGITNTFRTGPLRVKFWYDPEDPDGLYVGTWETTPTCTATASSNSPVCEGETIELYGGPAGMDSYSWTGPNSFSSSEISPTIEGATLAMAGTYTLTVTASDSCTATATTSITVNEKPTATASSNSPVCEGQPLKLYGGPPGMTSYSWTGPDSFSSDEISPTVSISATTAMAGTYYLTVTSNNGCTDTASHYVTVTSGDYQGYLDPQQSNASYCNTTDVEIWVNATGFKSGAIKLTYNSTCADVTDWVANTTDFPLWTWDSTIPGQEWITFYATEPITGTYLIGTLTIHCVSEDECTTDLDFVEDGVMATKLFDDWGSEIPGIWQDGTFACGLGACGDVAPVDPACDGIVNMGDVGLLHSYVGHPGEYSLCCEWCGDVAPVDPGCDGIINMGDVGLLHSYVGHPGEYSLCCGAGGGGAALAAPAVSAVADNEVNLVPQESSAPFGETADVEIQVDATNFQSGQIDLTYISTCADVTDWEPNLDDFSQVTWDSDTSGEEWITFLAQAPITGTYRIGTLTIHAAHEGGCETILNFVEGGPRPSKLFDDWGDEISATWADGTFRSVKTYKVYLPLIMKTSQ